MKSLKRAITTWYKAINTKAETDNVLSKTIEIIGGVVLALIIVSLLFLVIGVFALGVWLVDHAAWVYGVILAIIIVVVVGIFTKATIELKQSGKL